jgi:flagellar hook-length control protein FliK
MQHIILPKEGAGPPDSASPAAMGAKARKAAKKKSAFSGLLQALQGQAKKNPARQQREAQPAEAASQSHDAKRLLSLLFSEKERARGAEIEKSPPAKKKGKNQDDRGVGSDASNLVAFVDNPSKRAEVRDVDRKDSREVSERIDGAAKPDEATKRAKFQVIDARSDKPKDAEPGAKDASRPAIKQDSNGAKNEVSLTLEAKGAPEKAPGDLEGPKESFASTLEGRLKEAYGDQIVKAARIVLADNDTGTIRLTLRPESLGDVKIELKVADNKITGSIVVASDEAKGAFERSIVELQDAFSKSGFESAKLDVALDQRGRGGGRDASEAASPFFSERLRSFDVQTPSASQATARERGLDILI